MDILLFIIIGLLAGWIAGEIMRGRGFGLIGNLIVGLIGALIGGFIFRAFGVGTTGFIGSLIAAIIGAVILLWISSFFSRSVTR